MKRALDPDTILAPIPGENPGGEDLRYSQTYEDIKEARRFDDPLEQGDWKHALKAADWDKVITLSVDALSKRSKDLQIAAWLSEALLITEGFDGLTAGLGVINGLLTGYWETLYPPVEEGDLDFRGAPLEFMNERLWSRIKEVPMTDKSVTPGYSWLKWQESREVGYDADTRNKYGDVDENKKKKREDHIAEGKLTAEEFDAATVSSRAPFYTSLADSAARSLAEFKRLDTLVDEKFGSQGPRLAEFGKAIEECIQLLTRIRKEKGAEPDIRPDMKPEEKAPSYRGETRMKAKQAHQVAFAEEAISRPVRQVSGGELASEPSHENVLWEEALRTMEASGMKKALDQLLDACFSAPSVREKNRYRLLIAKLCLKAERPDLARPIVEELQALIEELHLERWESPLWIAQVLEALYQCLTTGEPSDDDIGRARVLFQRLCTTDVTKALTYRH